MTVSSATSIFPSPTELDTFFKHHRSKVTDYILTTESNEVYRGHCQWLPDIDHEKGAHSLPVCRDTIRHMAIVFHGKQTSLKPEPDLGVHTYFYTKGGCYDQRYKEYGGLHKVIKQIAVAPKDKPTETKS